MVLAGGVSVPGHGRTEGEVFKRHPPRVACDCVEIADSRTGLRALMTANRLAIVGEKLEW
jgi:hypothetical protein